MEKEKLKKLLRDIKPKTYTENEVVKIILNLRETLSDLEHEQWSHWEKYREERLNTCVDFSGQLANWRRLREKSYQDLTDKEKESDREWADKVISVILNKFMTPAGFREALKKEGLMGKKFNFSGGKNDNRKFIYFT